MQFFSPANTYIIIKTAFKSMVALFYVIYFPYLLSFGLSNFQINFINAIFFHFVVFGLDFPTGVFGDLFGKKLASILGFFAYSAGAVMFAIGDNFWHFALGEFLSAIGFAFISGSFLAWMIELVGEKKFAEVEGNSEFWIGLFSFVTVSLSGILSYLYWFRFVIWIEAVGILLISILAMILMQKDTSHHTQTKSLSNILSKSKESWKIARSNKLSLSTAILNSISWVGIMSMFIYWQPIFLELGLSQQYAGFLFGFFGLAMGFGSRFVSKISIDKIKLYSLILFLTGSTVLLSALLLKISLIGSILFFLVFEFLVGAKLVLSNTIYNMDLNEENRASVNSVYSTIEKVGSTLGLLLIGVLADVTSRSFTWYLAAIVFAVVSILSYTMSRTNKNSKIKIS